MVWVLVALYAGLVALAFMIANAENSNAKKASELAGVTLRRVESLEARLVAIEKKAEESRDVELQAQKKLVDDFLQLHAQVAKLKEKIDWIEMKVSNLPKQTSNSKVTLSQDSPLRVLVVTRPGPPVGKKKTKDDQAQTKDGLVEEVKKKMMELSR